ncbi:MAG: hypothetical protein WCO83_02315 [Alphaproteobacteria bacterium]
MDQTSSPHLKRSRTAHRVLTALCIEPMTIEDLKVQCAEKTGASYRQDVRRRRKVWFAADMLVRNALVSLNTKTGLYSITPEGLDELDRLGPIAVRTLNPSPEKETA